MSCRERRGGGGGSGRGRGRGGGNGRGKWEGEGEGEGEKVHIIFAPQIQHQSTAHHTLCHGVGGVLPKCTLFSR